jgi:hypothetical protein
MSYETILYEVDDGILTINGHSSTGFRGNQQTNYRALCSGCWIRTLRR